MKLLTLTSCLLIACPVFITDAFSPKAFFKDTSFSLGNARARPNYPLATNNNGLNMTPSGDEEPTLDRRGWIKKVVAGGAVTGLVANKIAIRGPEPYQPRIGSLKGKVIVITGGNTGLGLESAKRLAKGGATVVLTSRNKQKGELAVQDVKDYCERDGVTNNNIYTLPLDLCDLESVKAFPDLFKQSPVGDQKIDVLMNNAGVMAVPELELTKDGYEKTFQSNHLGHFALTAGLIPLLNPTASSVINISSAAYMIAKTLTLDNLNGENGYGPWDAYGQSKLQNILFTKELQRRAEEAKINLTATALHPGAVRTDLARYLLKDNFVSMQDKEAQKNIKISLGMVGILPLVYFTKSVDRGATTQIWLTSGQGENVGGKFFQNCKALKLNSPAEDMEKAKQLWNISEKLSGVKFEF